MPTDNSADKQPAATLNKEEEYARRQICYELSSDVPRRMLPIYGAICGDVAGSIFERFYEQFTELGYYTLVSKACHVTDDTVFTIAVAEALLDGASTAKGFTEYMVKWGRRYPNAGFGNATQRWIHSDNPQPYGSNRNGAAMRVAPCACFASSLDEAVALAQVQAQVSHNTPEGVAGAQAIAAAVFLALQGESKEVISQMVQDEFGYDLSPSLDDLRRQWHGFSCTAAETVPQSIICFLDSYDVESAIRGGISLCSDADTLASMAAAIAAPHYGELPFLDSVLELVPDDMLEVLEKCSYKLVNM